MEKSENETFRLKMRKEVLEGGKRALEDLAAASSPAKCTNYEQNSSVL